MNFTGAMCVAKIEIPSNCGARGIKRAACKTWKDILWLHTFETTSTTVQISKILSFQTLTGSYVFALQSFTKINMCCRLKSEHSFPLSCQMSMLHLPKLACCRPVGQQSSPFCMGRWSRHSQVWGRVVFFVFSEKTGNVPGGNKSLECQASRQTSPRRDEMGVNTSTQWEVLQCKVVLEISFANAC